MEQLLLAYGLPKETVAAITMLYKKNTKVKVCSLDRDSGFFDIVAGVLQADSLAPYLFIIRLDYVLQTSVDLMKENGFTLAKARSRKYPAWTIMDADYADNIALLANTPAQAESLLRCLERAAGGMGLQVNADKTEFMCFNKRGDISTLNGRFLKLVNKLTYLGSSVSSTEKDINTRLTKAWNSDLSDKIKGSFFQAVIVSLQLYGCTTWTLTKLMKRNIDSNYTGRLRAVLNKSWR